MIIVPFIKCSILCLYLRIFTVASRTRIAIWAVGCFVVAFHVSGLFASIFICSPIRRFWDPSVKGTCIKGYRLGVVSATQGAVTDVIILLLPVAEVWKLKMPLNQRLGLLAIFATGSAYVPWNLFILLLLT